MKYYVIINGESSLDIQGLAIESLPAISKPLMRSKREEIDGRNGDIITQLGYGAYDKTLKIGLWGDYDINEVITFFNQEGTITFSNEPDMYYNFTILNRIDFINQLEAFRKATITIHCQPFKYKEEETEELEIEEHQEEGTSFNLESTIEAPMQIDLKGNTSQETTTGKNLFKETGVVANGTYNNGLYTSNSLSSYQVMNMNGENITYIANTKYYISMDLRRTTGTGSINAINVGTTTGVVNHFPTISNEFQKYYIEFTPTSDYTSNKITVQSGNVSVVFEVKNLMVSTSSDTNFEKYTGGNPAPNPDYPQDIHNVSGNNSIVVCGKNLFDKTTIIEGKYIAASGIFVNDSNIFIGDIIGIDNTKTYYLNANTSNVKRVAYYDSSQTFISREVFTALGKTLTIPNNAKYLRLSCYNQDLDTLQLEVSNQATTYEAYNGTTYPINLPVENLFDKDNANIIDGNLADGGTLSLTNNARTLYIPCKNNTTYTITKLQAVYFRVAQFTNVPQIGDSYISRTRDDLANSITFTTTTGNYLAVTYWYKTSTYTEQQILDSIQVEYGSKSNAYTPYGTTPIELNKIGTYEDNFLRNSGKNLFDKDNANIINNYIEDNTGNILRSNNARCIYIPCKANTNYTISKIVTPRFTIGLTDTLPTTNVTCLSYLKNNSATSLTIQGNANAKYLVIYLTNSYDATTWQNILDSIQIEKGNQATPYEPYGSGKWYLHKEIEKITLSNCNWVQEATASSRRYGAEDIKNIVKKPSNNGTTMDLLSNIYIKNNASWSWNTTSGKGICIQTNGAIIVYDDNYTASTDLSNFTTMLSNKSAILYYPLANTTNTEITDTTLISQLEAIYNAKSKNGTTNINQENNDLPFILDVSYLSGTDNITITNHGNYYSKPKLTLTGTGNIGIYLNDSQIFQVSLGTNETIIIDTDKMEAYYESTLKNRQVIGDYNSFKLLSGENTIRISGTFSKLQVDNYSRWI